MPQQWVHLRLFLWETLSDMSKITFHRAGDLPTNQHIGLPKLKCYLEIAVCPKSKVYWETNQKWNKMTLQIHQSVSYLDSQSWSRFTSFSLSSASNLRNSFHWDCDLLLIPDMKSSAERIDHQSWPRSFRLRSSRTRSWQWVNCVPRVYDSSSPLGQASQ
jgi:hypothetical protein